MRLDEFDPNAINIEDQRGGGRRLPGGRGGQVGCGTLIIALIGALVFGVDPGQLIGGLEQVQSPTQQTQIEGGASVGDSCRVDAGSLQSCNTLSSLNKTWAPVFAAANVPFQAPKLVFFSQAGQSGCGAAQSAMGPFYCPADQGIYLDTDFFDQMDRELGARGKFARDYVIAHEYGHHIQKLTGVSDQIRSLQGQNPRKANALSVRLELQADCYAGVWAAKNRDRLEAGDMESGLNAAAAIGDDTLMRNAGRRASPEQFTHGTSAQRMEWLRKGMQSADDSVCDALMR
ncbi:MAG: neutral zinc metallopeptidase [Novosphingobium sp.]|jgi:predicted metalloprotease|nr:neutral zinc metallopeptidase [Novosphingobium sp.]MBP6555969.1 neutral zinc metallopeptidase [Novosphingobium sp.]